MRKAELEREMRKWKRTLALIRRKDGDVVDISQVCTGNREQDIFAARLLRRCSCTHNAHLLLNRLACAWTLIVDPLKSTGWPHLVEKNLIQVDTWSKGRN